MKTKNIISLAVLLCVSSNCFALTPFTFHGRYDAQREMVLYAMTFNNIPVGYSVTKADVDFDYIKDDGVVQYLNCNGENIWAKIDVIIKRGPNVFRTCSGLSRYICGSGVFWDAIPCNDGISPPVRINNIHGNGIEGTVDMYTEY